MESAPVSSDRLVWTRRDIERRFGFRGSRFTRVGSLLPAILAAAMTVAFFAALIAIGHNAWTDMFTERGWTPYVIVFFTLWALATLLFKRSKLKLQRRALQLEVIPDEMDFVLSTATVDRVIQRLYEVSDDPKQFVLLHRIYIGLSSVQNLGRAVDLGEILRTQSDHDESVMETSYNSIRGLVWAIPILGFIGTVSGLSYAIGGFGRVLSQTEDPSQLIDALKGVTGGLATAFETTLLALIAALLVQMMMTFQKKREEEFLDECTDYCQREVLSRLRSADPLLGADRSKAEAPAVHVPPPPSDSMGTKTTPVVVTEPVANKPEVANKPAAGKKSAVGKKAAVVNQPAVAQESKVTKEPDVVRQPDAVEVIEEAEMIEEAEPVEEAEVADDLDNIIEIVPPEQW